MTTMSEIVLVVCLVREQLLQYMVAIIQYASEEVVIAIGGKFCDKRCEIFNNDVCKLLS